jgi:hypothetical protein
LFVFGAWCALGGVEKAKTVLRSRTLFVLCVAYLLFAFAVTLTWHIPALAPFMPKWLAELIYPINKTDLDVLRLLHFGALAVITVRFVPQDWPALTSPLLRPAIICGQHSLEIFCLGVFLAFTGHFILVEISDRISMQIAISAIGIALMVAAAAMIGWYKVIEGRRPGPRPPKSLGSDLAGGEA